MDHPPRAADEQLSLFQVPEQLKFSHVIKRNGRVVDFDKTKIVNAIYKAAVSVGGKDRALAEKLAGKVLATLNQLYPPDATPSVEEIQDVVEEVLIKNGHAKTAKAFIIYRAEHQMLRTQREEKVVIEAEDTVPYKTLWKVFTWNVDHECETIEKLNRHVEKGTWPQLIAAAEKQYHDEINKVAKLLVKRGKSLRLVIVAGPSSSGKTTTTMKIGEALAAQGNAFVLMNLDNYFKNLSEHPKDEYGDYDFEPPQALDLELVNDHLARLLRGLAIQMPVYNFKTGVREKQTVDFRLAPNQILLIDSLHGLYDDLTKSVPAQNKFKFYIEALCQIKDKKGEFVRWTDLRLLRRMVRDSWHRSYNPQNTVGHWHYVRRSEMRYIVPYIRSVDYVFNGALPYELAYHRRHMGHQMAGILKAFEGDPKKMDAYLRAERVNRLLESLTAPTDDTAVPPRSLLREFIGGSEYGY